jgi:hypothetical protein
MLTVARTSTTARALVALRVFIDFLFVAAGACGGYARITIQQRDGAGQSFGSVGRKKETG